MATDPRHTTVTATERDADAGSGGPVEAYFMDAGGGKLTLGTGAKSAEATAFLKDNGSDALILDDDPAAEERPLYAFDTKVVI